MPLCSRLMLGHLRTTLENKLSWSWSDFTALKVFVCLICPIIFFVLHVAAFLLDVSFGFNFRKF